MINHEAGILNSLMILERTSELGSSTRIFQNNVVHQMLPECEGKSSNSARYAMELGGTDITYYIIDYLSNMEAAFMMLIIW